MKECVRCRFVCHLKRVWQVPTLCYSDLEKESEELEFEVPEEDDLDPPSLTDLGQSEESGETEEAEAAASLDLPPMPEFGEG